MTRGSRRGFLLAVVVMVSAVAGALVLALHTGVLTRGRQVKLASDSASARFLARGALSALRFAALEACQPPPPGVPLSTRGADLGSWLLAAPEALAVLHSGDDDRAWLTSRLGVSAFAPVDRLAHALPDASVRVYVEVSVLPRAASPVRDPVVKSVVLSMRAVARVRQAEAEQTLFQTLNVYSQLPVAAKFTFAATAAGELATARGFQDGSAAPQSDNPVVLIHHPADGDPLAADPFAAGALKPYVARSVASSEVVTAHAARGLVYLASGTERPEVWLPLAGGGGPFGEAHALVGLVDGHPASLAARPLTDQPAAFRSFAAPDPLEPDVKQGAAVQGAVLPLFEGLDESLLGPHPDPAAMLATAVSRLKLHGTAAMPSPTAVIGPAFHVLAAIADVAVDRDVTDADENAQVAAAGRKLPVREGIEPFLAWADEEAFDADVETELSAAEPSYGRLKPFGKQGQIANQNAWMDVGGERVAVASEAGHDPIHLDLTYWKYSNLFSGYADYRRVMSHYISIPVNLSLDLAGRPAEQALELLRQAAFGKSAPGGWSDFVVTRVQLAHRDALHAEPAVAAGGPLWLDTSAAPEALGKALAARTGERWPGEPAVVVHGQRAFERLFMPSGVLDLAGQRVVVQPADGEPLAPLSFDRPLAVKPGSGGVLEVPRLAAPAILNAPGAGYAPLVVHTGELVLRGRGPFEAILSADAVKMENVGEPPVIRGSLVVGAVPSGLMQPLVVAWDPRADPTGEGAAASYRIAPGRNSFTPLPAP